MNTPDQASDTQINRLMDLEHDEPDYCGCREDGIPVRRAQCRWGHAHSARELKGDEPDTSPSWDGVADRPAPDETWTIPEAITTLEYYEIKAMRRKDTDLVLEAIRGAIHELGCPAGRSERAARHLEDYADIAFRAQRPGEANDLMQIAGLIRHLGEQK